MLEQLGDKYTDSAQGVFDTTAHRFEGIHRSTWADMEDLGYIRRDDQITGKATPEYLLTPAGWYAAQDRLDSSQNRSEFVSKLARLSKALKDCIKAENSVRAWRPFDNFELGEITCGRSWNGVPT
jgi:hypothetical protein